LLDYLRGKSLINIDNASIAQRLQKSQSSISEIRINKDFPDTINIYLNSYKLVFQTQHHFILENGSVILKENEQYPDTQFIYLSEDISEYVDFQKKLRTQELNTIHTIIDESKKNIL
jgi:cell division septal protein FtsQ